MVTLNITWKNSELEFGFLRGSEGDIQDEKNFVEVWKWLIGEKEVDKQYLR